MTFSNWLLVMERVALTSTSSNTAQYFSTSGRTMWCLRAQACRTSGSMGSRSTGTKPGGSGGVSGLTSSTLEPLRTSCFERLADDLPPRAEARGSLEGERGSSGSRWAALEGRRVRSSRSVTRMLDGLLASSRSAARLLEGLLLSGGAWWPQLVDPVLRAASEAARPTPPGVEGRPLLTLQKAGSDGMRISLAVSILLLGDLTLTVGASSMRLRTSLQTSWL
mmetsp:Transcript_24855/g.77263  ORF Transcript_24855/g.77263 Transcript_24855/m.77263 type:complete len:222 (-) Transcript_24855:38-703(-)